ncbi:MAG: hypothetical protein ACP5XB_24405 [Isosphaeraceae bacterium]
MRPVWLIESAATTRFSRARQAATFSCSWLYACDLAAVVAEASRLAEQSWARSQA